MPRSPDRPLGLLRAVALIAGLLMVVALGALWQPARAAMIRNVRISLPREGAGAAGVAQLYSVDISGRNLKAVPMQGGASDPAWSPLLP